MEKNNVTLHRVLTASPEKVFHAFSEMQWHGGYHLIASPVKCSKKIFKLAGLLR